MVVHGGSADVTAMIEAARNSEVIILAQCLNAVKPKLMMKGGRTCDVVTHGPSNRGAILGGGE